MKKSDIGKIIPKNEYKYKINFTNQFRKDDTLTLILTNTGTHSEIFE